MRKKIYETVMHCGQVINTNWTRLVNNNCFNLAKYVILANNNVVVVVLIKHHINETKNKTYKHK